MARMDDIIGKIVSLEWEMFQSVNEGGPRAPCQEDRETFSGMRRAQFEAWPPEACASYFDDLTNAMLDGRNLVAEKYIHMMKNTAPAQYETLVGTIPRPDAAQTRLAREISGRLLTQTAVLHETYPRVSGAGRPLRAVQDFSGVISIETYQLGELLTYSEKTLSLLKAHLLALERAGRALARDILENTVRYYGYETLESAEAAAKARAAAEDDGPLRP
ncbi:Protein of unknown function [Sporobacter termitidis DSM 10068]|uniref:DUF4125 domain-containing protein n=1 Tax=Sporobacter termitidis DSM 10068 TaxID=1123282 RepID=A0A1M5TEP9_9FIRM|nr:DUF4125 family protein [Sporobacter termitidis]SHH49189.1 Protein of unknown function [Sporobacter termitidis DSM 10068]